MSGSTACTVRGTDHVLVYLNRYNPFDTPAAWFVILERANLVNGAKIEYRRRFPPQMCITSGAYSETSRVFFSAGYRIDTGAVQVVVLAADTAPNAPGALFVLHVTPFVCPSNLDRMVWIVDPVPAPLGHEKGGIGEGRVALDIIIEQCTVEMRLSPAEEETQPPLRGFYTPPRAYVATQHRLVFDNMDAMFPEGSSSVPVVPQGVIVVSTGLERRQVYETSFYSTVTHWTAKFLDNNLGMVRSLALDGLLLPGPGEEEEAFSSRFAGNVPVSTERAILTNGYIRVRSRLASIGATGDMSRITAMTSRVNFIGRRAIEVGVQVDRDTGKGERERERGGQIVVSAFHVPESQLVRWAAEQEMKQSTRTAVPLQPLDVHRVSAGINDVSRRCIGAQWLDDEWVLGEDHEYKLRVYFLPDPVKNMAAFLDATVSSQTSPLKGLGVDILLDIADEVARVQKSAFVAS